MSASPDHTKLKVESVVWMLERRVLEFYQEYLPRALVTCSLADLDYLLGEIIPKVDVLIKDAALLQAAVDDGRLDYNVEVLLLRPLLKVKEIILNAEYT